MEINEPCSVYILNAATHAVVSVYATYKVKHDALRVLLAVDGCCCDKGEAYLADVCLYAGLHYLTVAKRLLEFTKWGYVTRTGRACQYNYALTQSGLNVVQHYYNTIEAIRGDKNKPKKPETNGHRVAKKKRDTTL